jgi:hypothetical protein
MTDNPPREPRTEAGKALLAEYPSTGLNDAILAIEAEAAEQRATLDVLRDAGLVNPLAEAAAPRSGEGLRERLLALDLDTDRDRELVRLALAAAPREASEPLRNAGEVMRNGPSDATPLPDELPFSVAARREANEPVDRDSCITGFKDGMERQTSEPQALDAAWAEAEAALPNGWRLRVTRADESFKVWQASAVSPEFFDGENDNDAECAMGEGDSPAAALHALAARLRDEATSEEKG